MRFVTFFFTNGGEAAGIAIGAAMRILSTDSTQKRGVIADFLAHLSLFGAFLFEIK